MAIDNLKEVDTGNDSNAGKTNLKLDAGLVADLKQEVGVSQNTQVSPVVAAAVAEYLGDSDRAEEYEDAFVAQFEEE